MTRNKAHNLILMLIILSAAIACLAGCSGSKEGNSREIKIVAADFPSYDFARHVAGDRADIRLLIKPGNGIHSYEPTPKDIIDICECDLFIYAGGESDEWADRILDAQDTVIDTLAMMDAVSLLEEEEKEGMQTEGGEEEETEYDEHVWTSPVNAVKICEAICEKLSVKYPQHADEFSMNTGTYTKQIEELDGKFRELFRQAEEKGPVTLVFGGRFPLLYFAREYGIDYFAAFPGCAEETEPDPKTVVFLADKIREEGIKTVFYIELSNKDLAEVLANETGARTAMFHSCHNVTKEEFERGETYLSLMNGNYEVLKEAMQ